MYLIDTHTHLYDASFDEDIDDVIQKAVDLGIDRMLLPNCDIETMDRMLKLHNKFPKHCLPMLGLHPCYIKEDYQSQLEAILTYKDQSDYVAIGEIGLDYYWDKTFVDQQKEAFNIQMDWALDMKLPIVIHTRDSLDEGIEMLQAKQNGSLKGVFHCFGGDEAQAQKIIDLGFKMGIGGVVTFKNSPLKDYLKNIPLEHIILETDAPYLAPVPFRGKRNESAYINNICEFLCTVYQQPKDEVARITTQNAIELFNLK